MAYDVDEKYIISTEQKLGIRFPESYRRSIMKNNGGVALFPPNGDEDDQEDWQLLSIYDDSDKKRLKRTALDLIYENKQFWNAEDLEWPKDFYAITRWSNDGCLAFKKGEGVQLEPAVYRYGINNYELELQFLAADFSELAHNNF